VNHPKTYEPISAQYSPTQPELLFVNRPEYSSTVSTARCNFRYMRLLELTSHGELRLTEFVGDSIPPYAILSHTWAEDGNEITFDDLGTDIDKNTAAYKKLKFCGDQAVNDGLRYFWVDTCCINKLNPIELQQAINSMFRWYRDAAKCYVYLSDVSIYESGNNQTSQLSWELAFRTSRWFTRGWTLQELIAPELVEFFSEQGNLLGDKKSLEQQIHEITWIPVQALQGRSLLYFTVDERMLWAKNRQTKYEEDKVYSLQGIFDVCMPLLYGEGEERAFIRLREEINRRSTGK
jgi:Heterokaryon incompatibility protein (HET)